MFVIKQQAFKYFSIGYAYIKINGLVQEINISRIWNQDVNQPETRQPID